MQAEEYIKGETHSKNLRWNQGLESIGRKHRDTCPENLVEGALEVTAEPHPVGA